MFDETTSTSFAFVTKTEFSLSAGDLTFDGYDCTDDVYLDSGLTTGVIQQVL